MEEGFKKCPYCGEDIKAGANKCRYCGEFLNENEIKVESYGRGNNNRMRRGIFFRNMMILFLVESAILFIIGLMGVSEDAIDGLAVLISVVAISFQVPRTIKRCHDIGWSGWWTLLFILPLLCLLMYIIPGTDGDNKYGSKPN